MRVHLFGSQLVEGVGAESLGSHKGRTLLRLLALGRGRPVDGDRLAECLWRAEPPKHPNEQLSVLASRLRRVLGSDRILRREGGYSLAAEWLDVDVVADCVHEAARALGSGDAELAARLADEALTLAGAGELGGEDRDEPWLTAERAVTDRLLGRARNLGASAALARGQPSRAALLAEAALECDPFDEAALRAAMTAHALEGRAGTALALYARVKSALGEELGVEPSAPTEALHDDIVLGRPVEAPPAPSRRPVPADTALVGRDRELAMLDAALADARAGRSRLVVLAGEAGTGKTFTITSWVARQDAVEVLRLAAGPGEEPLALQPLWQALAARADPSSSPAVWPPSTAAPMGVLVGAAQGEHAVVAALAGAVRELGASTGRPVIVVVDDAARIDRSTVAALRLALAASEPNRLLVLAARTLPRPDRFGDGDVTIELGPLDESAAIALAGAERGPLLHRRSGGHPLLLAELATAHALDPADDSSLPQSLVAAVRARLVDIGDARDTLEAAAVLGPPIDVDLLADVLRLAPGAVLGHLEVGAAHRALVADGDSFAFRHDLVRDAIAAGAAPARQSLLHREAARALAARPAGDPLAVAEHATRGGETLLAAHALGQAAALATERFAFADAGRYLEQALRLCDPAASPALSRGLQLQRARVLLAQGRFDLATGAADDAFAAGGGTLALEVAGWAAYYQRRVPDAEAAATDGISLAGGPTEAVGCLLLGGRVAHSEGHLAIAIDRFEQAMAAGDADQVIVARAWLGQLRAHEGRADEALRLVDLALRSGSMSHPYALVHARLTQAIALGLRGRGADALGALDRLDAETAQRSITRFAARSTNWRAWILRNLGAASEAHDANERALDEATSKGLAEPRAHALLDLADGSLRDGDLTTCARWLGEAAPLDHGTHAFRWRHQRRGQLLRARLALAAGEFARAQEVALGVAELAESDGVPRYLHPARILLAISRARLGEAPTPEAVYPDVEAIGRVASLEAWWLTAEVATALAVDAWRALAATRLAELAAAAGDYAHGLRRWGATVLEQSNTARRTR